MSLLHQRLNQRRNHNIAVLAFSNAQVTQCSENLMSKYHHNIYDVPLFAIANKITLNISYTFVNIHKCLSFWSLDSQHGILACWNVTSMTSLVNKLQTENISRYLLKLKSFSVMLYEKHHWVRLTPLTPYLNVHKCEELGLKRTISVYDALKTIIWLQKTLNIKD